MVPRILKAVFSFQLLSEFDCCNDESQFTPMINENNSPRLQEGGVFHCVSIPFYPSPLVDLCTDAYYCICLRPSMSTFSGRQSASFCYYTFPRTLTGSGDLTSYFMSFRHHAGHFFMGVSLVIYPFLSSFPRFGY
jgi:hypothetical protein